MDAQIKKGILEMCILQLLAQEPMYGYPLMKYIRTLFPEVDESTVYAILRRLYKEGFADSYFAESSEGPKRKYYSITEEGRERLEEYCSQWDEIVNIVNEIKGGKFYEN